MRAVRYGGITLRRARPAEGGGHGRRGLAAAAVLGALACLVLAGCATTDPATNVVDNGATLNGVISPGGKPTTYWFQYGTSTSYGDETPHRDGGSGNAERSVSETIGGLSPSTVYHYRLCADSGSGVVCYGDVTFKTVASETLPSRFRDTAVFTGLTQPTAVRFASDGRVFVAEKSGLIKVFDSLTDPSPTTFADLRTSTYNFWDRGLLGLALDPQFPTKPYVYVLYSYDAPVGGTAPRWGTAGATSDPCPTPPGPTTDGCVISSRLSRLTASGDTMSSEKVLLNSWCQQFPSHSVGSLVFGADGALYASAGDGASFTGVDYGQVGGQPVRGPADGSPEHPVVAADRRGRGPAGAEPDPARRRAAVARRDPDARGPEHGRRAPRQPDGLELRRQRPPHRGLRLSQPVPLHDPARHQRAVGRRRRLGRLGGDQPGHLLQPGEELRLALLRGRRPAGGLRRLPG